MPRAKPKREHGWLWRARLELPTDDIEEMVEICGVDDEERDAFREAVEESLHGYYLTKADIDDAPRPANILAALNPVCRSSTRLRKALAELDRLSVYSLKEHGFRDPATKELLRLHEQLEAAIGNVRRAHEGAESRHRPTKHALRILVRMLSNAFDTFARIDFEMQGRQLRPESLRLDFVQAVLAATTKLRIVQDAESDVLWPLGALQPIKGPSRERLSRMLAEFDQARKRAAT